ncbi:hypothetical protein [Aphanothece sacrum]|uniref:Alpha globin n=1 Tax=Aphanothece sacrum FPU1 TaxID=1920663 RepID=A0A401ILG4_APHSA|nr:hypothetical protein [Aphanothece sacrum]GBF82092.1 alpha globin [Aphanothece sacrum FPU1]GBF85026.1 hypothetical protein AsFPU3_2081 [Aphanothece sacrum FPU3]
MYLGDNLTDLLIETIIEKYKEHEAELGPYSIPTKETIQIMNGILDVVHSVDLVMSEDLQEGHISVTVLHAKTSRSDNTFAVGFSGGKKSQNNFHKIHKKILDRGDTPNFIYTPGLGILKIVNKTDFTPDQLIRDGQEKGDLAIYFQYEMVGGVDWPCGEPKALRILNAIGGGELLGYASCWIAHSHLATPHRMNVSFIDSRLSFMLPCELCKKHFDQIKGTVKVAKTES